MGDEKIHPSPAQQESLASYSVIGYSGQELPESYHGLIYSKWLRSLRHGNDYFKLIDPKAYYESYRIYIHGVLQRPETVVRLAVLDDDHDVVIGFSISRHNVLEYIHVLRMRFKLPSGIEVSDFRRQGIGRRLIPKEIDTFTHITKTWLLIWNSKFRDWKFNPFA